MTKKFLLAFLTLTLTVFIISCGSGDSKDTTSQTAQKPQIDRPVNNPGVVQFTAYDIDGTLHHSQEWLGKQPVVINFWGTWCPPCRREMPDMVKLYEEYSPKGVEVVGLAVKDKSENVRRFAAEYKMSWVMLMGEDQVLIDFNAIQGVPTTIFLDRDGREVGRYVGMRSFEDLKKGFESIL